MAARPCTTCGTPTRTPPRCPTCQQAHNHTRNQQRTHYHGNWQTLSRTARTNQPWCTYCGTTQDLTLDHIQPATLTAGTTVACRTCNSSKGNRPTQPPPPRAQP